MLKKIKKTGNSGFTLVELAVVIAIVSTVIGSGIALFTSSLEAENRTITEAKLLYITEALNNYKDRFGFLPCPANPRALFSASDFGLGANNTTTTCNATSLPAASSTVVTGAVPTTTLAIPPSYAIDAWNKRITYAVDQDFTITSARYDGGTASITVNNLFGTNLTSAAAAIAVVVSHGQNGWAAYPGRGGSARVNATSGTNEEDENGDDDNTFVQSPKSGTFDDMVYYVMKWQLDQTDDRGQ